MVYEIPAAEHSGSCAIFTSWHEAAEGGRPGHFHPVPCDCGIGRAS